MATPTQYPEYMTVGDVSRLFHVTPKTISRWASEGKLPHIRTLGGHRRISAKAVAELVENARIAGTATGRRQARSA